MPFAPITHLLYLHGFRSSPQSAKARHVAAWVQQHRPDLAWCCPQLPPSPRAAMEVMAQCTHHWPDAGSAVIGSSLGGFYAAAVAAQRGWRAVLLNPAVDPARDLEQYIGENTTWHNPQDHFFFRPEFIGELRTIAAQTQSDEASRQTAGRLPPAYALICEGDEVLDWREMRDRYQHARQTILPGNDHAIGDFALHWPQVADWLGLPLAAENVCA